MLKNLLRLNEPDCNLVVILCLFFFFDRRLPCQLPANAGPGGCVGWPFLESRLSSPGCGDRFVFGTTIYMFVRQRFTPCILCHSVLSLIMDQRCIVVRDLPTLLRILNTSLLLADEVVLNQGNARRGIYIFQI